MPVWAIPVAMAAMGAMSGAKSGRHKKKEFKQDMYSQRTPYDFNPSMQGNQGADLLGQILGAYGGLLGNSINQFQQRPQGNPLQSMLSTMNQEFYGRRGQ